MIKAVTFDMDGVLIDARDWHYEALNIALEPFGYKINLNEHLEIFDGLPTSRKLEILSREQDLPRKLHGIISKVKQDRTLRIASEKCFPSLQHMILIQRLKSQGYSLAVYTNSIRKTTNFMLTHSNLIDKFDLIITNEDVKNPKPSPEGYLKAVEFFKLDASEMLVVEDGDYGIEAAMSAGCKVVQVLNPQEVNYENLLPYLGI